MLGVAPFSFQAERRIRAAAEQSCKVSCPVFGVVPAEDHRTRHVVQMARLHCSVTNSKYNAGGLKLLEIQNAEAVFHLANDHSGIFMKVSFEGLQQSSIDVLA